MSLIRKEVHLAPLTSWLVGGPAEFYAEPQTEAELEEAIQFARRTRLQLTFLGGGTNVLISDKGIRGLVIGLKRWNAVSVNETPEHFELEVQSGTSKSELLKRFLRAKLEPAVFLAGIPGDVGGGVVMNAGVGEVIRPREFVEITKRIEVWRWGENSDSNPIAKVQIEASQLQWSYRHCLGWQPGFIAKVWLSWPNEPKDDVLARVRAANQLRLLKQPLDQPSCGSVFANPQGDKSGRLIEACGLKGYRVGGAQVSLKHANFIVNTGGATAAEIDQVMNHVQEQAYTQTGIQLQHEVVYLGEWP